MLKKLSLIFIRFAPFLLAISVLSTILLYYCPISLILIETIDIGAKVLMIVGFIILSLTFKFCIYHRILLYCVLICYLIYLFNNIVGINIFSIALITFFAIATIILMIVVIYVYLKQKYERINRNRSYALRLLAVIFL